MPPPEPHAAPAGDGPSPRPARPLVAAALAAAVGAALGTWLAAGPGEALDPAPPRCALALVVLGALVLAPPGSLRGALARRPALLLVLLASLARSAAPAAGQELRDPGIVADALEAGGGRLEGSWERLHARGERDVGRIGPSPPVEVARGSLREGDAVRLLGVTRTLHRARLAAAPGQPPPVAAWQVLPDEVLVLERAPAPLLAPLARAVAQARQALRRRLLRLGRITGAGTGGEGAVGEGLALALVLGQRDALPEGLADLFTRTGTRHLLALSGLHLALFAWLLAVPLGRAAGALLARLGPRPGRARRGEALGAVLATLLLVLAVALGGGGPPLARAGWAAGLALWAAWLPAPPGGPPGTGRRRDGPSLLALALLLECLGDRHAPGRLDVQLSYAATAALVGVAGRARARLLPPPDPGFLPPSAPRLLARRLADALATGILASLVASLATLPVAWSAFGELAPAGIPWTPIVGLPVAALVVLGWAFAVLPLPFLAGWIHAAGRLTEHLLHLADALPLTPLPLPPRPPELLVLACALSLAALAGRPRARRPACLLLGLALLPLSPAARTLELHLLDVGHGTCAVLRAPGPWTLVFDAGSRDRLGLARDALGPALRRWEVRRPIVVLSHLDRDHAAALPWLVERFPPRLWAGALGPDLDHRLPPDCPRVDLDLGRLVLDAAPGHGHTPAPGPGAAREGRPHLELVRGWPDDGNEGSRSLLLRHQDTRLLLCGDAEDQGLWNSLRRGDLHGPFTAILVPHHGSDTPAVRSLLTDHTGLLWASCEGDPNLTPLLEAHPAPTHWTGRHGPLRVRDSSALESTASTGPDSDRQPRSNPVLPPP